MSKLVGGFILATFALPAFAQVPLGVEPTVSSTINATTVVIAVIGALATIISAVATAAINKYVKDTQAAAVLSNAVTNSLGAIKNAEDANLQRSPLTFAIPGVTPAVGAGIQYVLDHAGDEAARFGITPEGIADKIGAKLGLAKLDPTQIKIATPPPMLTNVR